MFCLHVCPCIKCMQMPAKARAGNQMPLDWSYNWLWNYYVGTENHQTAASSLQTLFKVYLILLWVCPYLGAHCHGTCLEVRDNSVRSVVSFQLSVGFGDQAQVIGLVQQAQAPLPKKPSLQPLYLVWQRFFLSLDLFHCADWNGGQQHPEVCLPLAAQLQLQVHTVIPACPWAQRHQLRPSICAVSASLTGPSP